MITRTLTLRAQFLLGASSAALLLGSASARAEGTNPFARMTNPSAQAAQAAAAQAQQGANASAASQRALAAFAQAAAIRGKMDSAQVAARAAAAAAQSTVKNGLGTGGLQVDPGVATDPSLWLNANAPTQSLGADGRTKVNIDQTGSQAILNWQTFNVGQNTDLTFNQPSTSSTVLNRVNDPSAGYTQILGTIKAPGTVLILNRNGVIFGGASQVNTHALLVAAGSMTDNQFLTRGIYSDTSSGQPLPSITTDAYDPTVPTTLPGVAAGAVTVEAGAQLTTTAPTSVLQGGGYVALLGGTVSNAGTITTARGQTLLAAGDAFNLRPGYGTDTNQISTTRGSEVAPVIDAASVNGAVSNTGLIRSSEGDITLAGRVVTQAGVAMATTSVNTRGTIHLLNAVSDSLGIVTLGLGSVTEIDPELDSKETALDGRRDSLIKQSLAQDIVRSGADYGVFNNLSRLSDRKDESRIEIVSGNSVHASEGAYALARGGQVAITAIGRAQIDSGAWLDASGVRDVVLPVAANVVTVNIQGNELRDAPVNRDNPAKPLFNQNVQVDTRDLILVPAGTGGYAGDRYYTKGGLLEVSGYVANIGHTIGEWAASGGTITLSAKEIVAQTGSTFNVEGGNLAYAGGAVGTTVLHAADGRNYAIGNAPADLLFTSVGQSFTVAHPRWGSQYTETYQTPFSSSVATAYEAGYNVGKDGGRLLLSAPTTIFAGDILADAVIGDRQVAPHPGKTSDSYTQPQSVIATAGGLAFGPAELAPSTGLQPLPATDVRIAPASVGPAPALDLAIAADRLGTTWLDTRALSDMRLGELSTKVAGTVSISGNLQLAPGAQLNLTGSAVTLAGTITARSGKIVLSNEPQAAFEAVGNVTLVAGSLIDAQGEWTNARVTPWTYNGAAYVDGGNVSISSTHDVTIEAGSTIDVSSGGL